MKTKDEIESEKKCGKIPRETKSIDPYHNIVKNLDLRHRFTKFNNVSVLSSEKYDFSLFVPPSPKYSTYTIEYDQQLIVDYFDFMKTRIEDNSWRHFMEMFYTIKYRLEHPDDLPVKFFIKHETDGKAGKSFTDACIKQIFGDFQIGVIPSRIEKDMFNNWQRDKLFIVIEEAEKKKNEAINLQNIETFIKNATTEDGSFRAMHQETVGGKNSAIFTLNTNESDLYGLINSDDTALLSRLVIILYKKCDITSDEWLRRRDQFLKNNNFGYSLYRYITSVLTYPDDFTAERYDGQHEILNYLRSLNPDSVQSFIEELKEDEGDGYCSGELNYNIITRHNGRERWDAVGVNVMYEQYVKHCQAMDLTIENKKKFHALLKNWGWEKEKNGSGGRYEFRRRDVQK
jgi:hypothetical protein